MSMALTCIKIGDYVLVKPNQTSLREFDMKVCVVVYTYSTGNITLISHQNEVIHLGRSKKLIRALYGIKL